MAPTSGAGGEPEEIGCKAEIGVGISEAEGIPDVNRTWPSAPSLVTSSCAASCRIRRRSVRLLLSPPTGNSSSLGLRRVAKRKRPLQPRGLSRRLQALVRFILSKSSFISKRANIAVRVREIGYRAPDLFPYFHIYSFASQFVSSFFYILNIES